MRYQTTRLPLHTAYNRPYARLEVTVLSGFARINMSGLSGEYARELQAKLHAAIRNGGFRWPRAAIALNISTNTRIGRDIGSDLAIALAILAADGQIAMQQKYAAIGDLGLDGSVLPVEKIVSLVQMAVVSGASAVIVPAADVPKLTAIASEVAVFPVRNLREATEVCAGLGNRLQATTESSDSKQAIPDLLLLSSQSHALKALEIAAAGWHPIILLGAPGSGKTHLAECLVRALPPLTPAERRSMPIGNKPISNRTDWYRRPIRAPHHRATITSMLGGGRPPLPGECAYADRGILLLDDMNLFDKKVLESLRRPLECGEISVANTDSPRFYRSQVLCVATARPCSCGYLYDDGRCRCTAERINQYRLNLKAPLGDRFDLIVRMKTLSNDDLSAIAEEKEPYVDIAGMRKRIEKAWERQQLREPDLDFPRNHYVFDSLGGDSAYCTEKAAERAARVAGSLSMTARELTSLFKVARTIADLRDAERIETEDIDLALFYHMD